MGSVEGTESQQALEPHTCSILEQPDLNYAEIVSKLALGDRAAVNPLDYIAMRKWLQEYVSKLETKPLSKRHREEVEVSISDVQVEYGANNRFGLRIYTPSGSHESPRPVLIVIHGGGWVLGLTVSEDPPLQFFASELDAVVISVDYRLAPEYPFPAAHNDCWETLNWVSQHATEYNLDLGRVALWGASAGGQLAASIALRDADENTVPRIRHVNLAVPALSSPDLYPAALKTQGSSSRRFRFTAQDREEDPTEGVRKLWQMYAGDKISDPYASVLLAKIPPNHPSVHISVGACDGLRDDGIAYALALRKAGVDAQLEVVPGVPHGINVSPATTVAIQWYRDQVRALYIPLRTDF